jgi:proteasome accessory factor B
MTKLQRWLDIIAFLVGRRLPVSGDEMMRNTPAHSDRWVSGDDAAHRAVRRSFERDKDELREMGIPIRTVKYETVGQPGVQEGYLLDRRDFYLPYLKLVKQVSGGREYPERARVANVELAYDDAPIALEALQRIADVPGFPFAGEARSAFRKLAFDLDPNAFAPGNRVLFVDRPGAAELTDRLRSLSDALLARKRVAFRYHGIYRDEETQRDVAAYGLLFQHGHWYLIGHDATRDDIRVFRVGRMNDVVINRKTPGTADYEIPDGFDLNAYVGREAWELGGQEEQPLHARVRFRFPLSLWAERNHHGALLERESDGATLRHFDVHQVQPFLRWVLSLEGEAEIVSPAALQEELHELARAVALSHGGFAGVRGAGDGPGGRSGGAAGDAAGHGAGHDADRPVPGEQSSDGRGGAP